MTTPQIARNYEITVLPSEDAELVDNEPYRVIVTPEGSAGTYAGAQLAYELPQGSTYHDARLVADKLNNINATLTINSAGTFS